MKVEVRQLFYLLVAGLSILIALLRGGKFSRIPEIDRLWLPPVAAILQGMTAAFPGTLAAMLIMILSYLVLVWFVVENWRFVGLRLLMIGIGLNLLVMATNGGRMPVFGAAMPHAGISAGAAADLATGMRPKHQLMTEGSPLAFLGDIIPMRYPISQVLSIGDLFILVGAFLFVQEGMGKRIRLFGQGEP